MNILRIGQGVTLSGGTGRHSTLLLVQNPDQDERLSGKWFALEAQRRKESAQE